jgi:glycosyltransferase involved in cell wall biosynthesis
MEPGQLQKQDLRGKASILFVTSSLDVGGTERHLALISGALQGRGWDLAVYSTGGEGPFAEVLRRNGVKVIVPPGSKRYRLRGVLRFPIAAVHLLGLLLRQRYTIVHCFLPEAYLIVAPLAVLLRTRVVLMSRRSLNNYQQNHPLGGSIERRLHAWMNAVLANSRGVAKQLEAEGVDARRIGLIYNGVGDAGPAPAGREQARSKLKVPGHALLLVIVANLIDYKGHLDLIEALGRIAGRMQADWQLLVVGRDDGLGTQIRSRAQALGLSSHVSLLGVRSDIADLLNASDIAVLASHQEGFSNAILECMQAGLPMIVTDVGGNAEAVVDGETGLVVPPHDPDALAGAILRLASDAQLRQRYGEVGRRRVQEHFSMDACVAGYEALYRGLLDRRTPGEIPQIRYK